MKIDNQKFNFFNKKTPFAWYTSKFQQTQRIIM